MLERFTQRRTLKAVVFNLKYDQELNGQRPNKFDYFNSAPIWVMKPRWLEVRAIDYYLNALLTSCRPNRCRNREEGSLRRF